jgi:hypothetical protein
MAATIIRNFSQKYPRRIIWDNVGCGPPKIWPTGSSCPGALRAIIREVQQKKDPKKAVIDPQTEDSTAWIYFRAIALALLFWPFPKRPRPLGLSKHGGKKSQRRWRSLRTRGKWRSRSRSLQSKLDQPTKSLRFFEVRSDGFIEVLLPFKSSPTYRLKG